MSQTQYICPKHKSPVQYVCAALNCSEHQICEICKKKSALHFSYHGNYIFRMKEFLEFNDSKVVIPKLEKGVQDTEAVINRHKGFYQDQIQLIKSDFQIIVQKFNEACEKYQKIYLENFQSKVDCFDGELVDLINNLKAYANEKSHQESFFSKLFAHESSQSIEDIISKNSKGFEIRASIVNLKSKLANCKSSKVSYKASESEQRTFGMLVDTLDSFTTEFFGRLNDLLTTESSENEHSESLKSSIVSQTNQLSESRAKSTCSINIEAEGLLINSRVKEGGSLVKVSMPELHPKVLSIKNNLKPLPEFTQSHSKDEGPFRYQNGVYLGSYSNGLRSGMGKFVFDDGTYYEGNWDNDNMEGYGRLISMYSLYEGDIVNGKAHGKGKYTDHQRTYTGQWKNDLRHGYGEEVFCEPLERKYIGAFINDKYEGKGKLFDPEFTYEGEFHKGKFSGEGIIKYRNKETFKGSFKNGQKVFGTHVFLDGGFYNGSFENDLPHGNGDFQWPDGIKYSGSWKVGNQHGLGIQTAANGRELRGIWENGSWKKWITDQK